MSEETLYRHVSGKGRVPIPEDEAKEIRAEWARNNAERAYQHEMLRMFPFRTPEQKIADLKARLAKLEQEE